MSIIIKSHGFKYSRPEANFVFDVSYLKNPWRKKELKTANKNKILAFMEEQKEFNEIVSLIVNVIIVNNKLWPDSKMIFAICCSEGTYRSPMVVKSIGRILKKLKIPFIIN